MLKIALFSAFVGIVSAAGCVDGRDNQLVVDDNLGTKGMDIHFKDVVGSSYDINSSPTCRNGMAEVHLPGYINLNDGFIIVTGANNLQTDGTLLVTLKKNLLLIGTVCVNGTSTHAAIPDKDCQAPVYEMFGPEFTQMLSTPGTYDLAKQNVKVVFPSIFNELAKIIDGEWYAEVSIVSNNRIVADFRVPSNQKWFVLHN